MDVCILGMKGNFNKDLGQGVQIYFYQIWKKTVQYAPSSLKVEKVELGLGSSPAARQISFTIFEAMHNFSGFDVVHMPAPVMFNPSCRGATLTTVHEFYPVKEGDPLYVRPGLDPNPLSLASAFIGKSIMNQMLGSDYLLPNSTQTLSEAAEKGYSRKRMFMVNHAIDDDFMKGGLPGSHPGKFRVGYLGSMHPRKNVAFALRAFNLIKSPNMVFDVWGKPRPDASDVVAQAAKNNRVDLRGFAPEESKISIYDGFDVFLFPSFYEGFGKEILEAQSRGLPVILYKSAKIPREVRKYCLEAQDEAHMAQLIEGISRNGYDQKKRKKAAEYARSFTWKRCALETIAAYRKIAKKG